MDGVVRQLYDYDGSNLFPRTKPSAFVSDLYDSSTTGITTIGELIDSSVPGEYRDPVTDASVDYEPEFVYRIPARDSEITGDASGTFKAVKLTDVSALHFDARLTEELTVTNIVGNAGKPDNPHCPNGTYPAGTLLEVIIMDILTGDGTIYDVEHVLPGIHFTVEYTRNGLDYNTLTSGQEVSANIGDSNLKLRYSFTFTDGKYKPTIGYDNAVFTLRNYTNAPENSAYFVNDNPPYLVAGSIATRLSLTSNNGSVVYNDETINTSSGITPRISDLGVVTSGTKLYVITVSYSASQSVPYRSNGTPSGLTITNGAGTFNFKITGVQAQVYDVRVGDIPSMMVGEFWHETGYIGVDVYDRNYTPAADNANLILKSKYDVQEDSSTGIWTGDSVSLFTKKSLYPSWTYTAEGEPIIMQLADASYPVVSPVLYYTDGDFVRESGYPVNLFQQYNPLASTDSLYAQCNLTGNPSIGIYKGNTEVYIQQTPYNTKVAKAIADIDHPTGDPDVSVATEYALWFNGTSGTLMDTGNTALTSSGAYTLKFKVPYTANTIIPKKSDGTSSNVSIAAGVLEKTSTAFIVNQEVDVKAIDPSIHIEAITIDNVGTYYNGNTVDLSTGTISGHYNFVVNNKEGSFTPESSTYTNTEFNNNNNTTGGKLAAGCQFSTLTLNVNGSTVGTCAGADLDSGGHGNIYFTNLPVTGNLTAQITGAHSGSTVTAKKRSTRDSSANINPTSALASYQFITRVTMPSMRSVKLIANPSNGGTVRFSSTPAPGGASDASTMTEGTSFTAIATPTANWSFVNWTKSSVSGTELSTSATYTAQVGNTDLVLYANFSAPVTPDYTARLLTTDKILESGTTTFISGINTVEDVLLKRTSGTQIWTSVVPQNLTNLYTTYNFDGGPINFGTNGSSQGRTIVAIVPATWSLKIIDLQLGGLNNSFYGDENNGFNNTTAVTTLTSSDGNTYKVYARKNQGTVDYQVSSIRYVKQ